MCRKIVFLIIIIISILYISTNVQCISFENPRTINVEVKGAVKEEKVVSLLNGSTINDLINTIDLTENADLRSVSLQETLYNNEIIVFKEISNEKLVSINNANIYELSVLPGIGKTIALNIIQYRKTYGGFIKLEDLINVKGIGKVKYEKIKPYICL